MNVLRIIVILVISKVAYSQILYSAEGQSLNFNFSYPCNHGNSSKVTLRFEFGAPIYSSTSPLQDSEEWIETSIDNLMVKQFRFESHCGLKLWLNPVMRIHAGTYIFLSYDTDRSPPEIASIELNVAFPPGKASCALSYEFTDNTDGQWIFLNCTASVGNIPGYVQCFQNGLIMPSITRPTKNGNIQQTFLVMTTRPAHCCSSTIEQPKSMCECRDALWNPFHIDEVTDPCQDTLTTSQIITDDILISTEISSSPLHTTNTSKDNDLNVLYIGLLVISCSIILVGSTTLLLRNFARYRKRQQNAKAGAISTSRKFLVESEPLNTKNYSNQASQPPVALEMERTEAVKYKMVLFSSPKEPGDFNFETET